MGCGGDTTGGDGCCKVYKFSGDKGGANPPGGEFTEMGGEVPPGMDRGKGL